MTPVRIEVTGPQRDVLRRIAGFFAARDVQAWATGGFLRDAILRLPVHDIDVTVAGDPLVLGPALAEQLGAHYFPLDEEKHQARLLIPDEGLHIDLMPLRQAQDRRFGAADIEADLRARDYTIDALAAPVGVVAEGGSFDVIDPTGGWDDLARGLVRATGEEALLDDPLRLLRGPRIATQLGFEIEAGTQALIRRHASLITSAALERQRDELMRIFATEHAADGMRLLEALGLFAFVLPEMEITRGVEQPKEHYHDVLGHSFACVENLDALLAETQPEPSPARELWDELWSQLAWCTGLRDYLREEIVMGTPRSAVLKFCGLLHDIGKPDTKAFDANGRMRFFGHGDVGADIAERLMRRLRFSGREIAIVRPMIEAHLRPIQMAQQGPPTKRAIYKFFRDTGEAGIDTLLLSLGDHLGTVGPRLNFEGYRQHVALVSHIIRVRYEEESVVSPPRLVDGGRLMAALGIGPGPVVGELLEAIREAQAAGEVTTADEALGLARERLERSRAGARE